MLADIDKKRFVDFLSVWTRQKRNDDVPEYGLWYSFGSDLWVRPKTLLTENLLEDFRTDTSPVKLYGELRLNQQDWKETFWAIDTLHSKDLSFLILVLKAARDGDKTHYVKMKYSKDGWLVIDTREATFVLKTKYRKEVVEDDLV